MNSLELYLILQVDNIKEVLCILPLLIFIISAVSIFVFAIEEKSSLWSNILFYSLTLLSLLTILITAFIPSSKNIAIIKILPKVVNNEEISKEFKEVYQLAKSGLKELINKTK